MSVKLLRAGPVSVTLEGSELRWLTVGPDELIRGVYVAVRDQDWSTVPGQLQDLRVDDYGEAFEVTFTSSHRERDLAFTWSGRINGQTDGSISFVMDGTAETAFLRNRIGFCLLHPPAVAGLPVTVETPTGPAVGEFPDRISAHQPFREILGIRWPTPAGGEADVRFEGDLFEMEDQRNWTDASFKTYCTPLRLPIPVRVEKGTKIHQAVHLRLGPARRAAARRAAGRAQASGAGPAVSHPDAIRVREPVGRLPVLGVALSPGHERLTRDEARHLRDRHLGLLFVTVDLAHTDWSSVVEAAAESVAATDTRLRIEVIADDAGERLGDFMELIAATSVSLDSVVGFPGTGYTTTRLIAEQLRAHAARHGITAAIIGGSRAHFTELNRSALPIDELDAIAYPISPQVHAFDDASIIETIAAQGLTVRDSLRIGRGRPVHVGPITLRPRFNAYAGPRANWGRESERSRIDPRQRAWFIAPWMLASISALAQARASSLIYFEAAGPAGFLGERPDEESLVLGPAEQVLAAVDGLAGVAVCGTDAPAGFATLALDNPDSQLIVVAHHDDAPRTVALDSTRRFGQVVARTLGPSPKPIVVEQSSSSVTFEVGPSSLVRVDLGAPGDPTS